MAMSSNDFTSVELAVAGDAEGKSVAEIKVCGTLRLDRRPSHGSGPFGLHSWSALPRADVTETRVSKWPPTVCRLPPPIRIALERAAASNCRSMNKEMEFRLRASLEREGLLSDQIAT